MSADVHTAPVGLIPGARRHQESLPAVQPEPDTGWCWYLAGGLFVLYSLASVHQHLRLGTYSFDLGIFEQAVRSYAHGQLPVSELRGHNFPLLGDHFSPVLAVLAPIYRLFPSAITLLVAQAALMAVAVVPIARLAHRLHGRSAAVVIGTCYGLSWGIAQALGYDFHEVAFAVPLLAFSTCALVEGRAEAAAAWALPLLTVKEDMGMTVVVIGFLVWRMCGRVRLGLATMAAGVVGFGIAAAVVRLNNPGGQYAHSHELTANNPMGGVGGLFHHFTVGLVDPEAKALLLVLLLVTSGFLALRSPIALVMVPTLGWRLYSNWPAFFSGHWQYNAVLMPVLFVAVIDGLLRMPGTGCAPKGRHALISCALVCALLYPTNFLASPLQPTNWAHSQRVDDANAVMKQVPDGANIAVSTEIAPHLTNRDVVSLIGGYDGDTRSDSDWILVDHAMSPWPLDSYAARDAVIAASRAAGFRTVFQQGDFELLHR